jgi:predicted Zn finger-like uncharacterized protein
MRIQCPSCSATYEVPDTLIDRPRTVRCAKCAHNWIATAIVEEVTAEPAEVVSAEPSSPLPELPGRDLVLEPEASFGGTPLSAIERLSAPIDLSPGIRRHDRILTAAWAFSFAALAALGVAGYTKRDTLMREWPASKRVYATLGLAPVDAKSQDGKDAADQPSH